MTTQMCPLTLFLAVLAIVTTFKTAGAAQQFASNVDTSEEKTSTGFNVWKTLRSNLQQNTAVDYGVRTGFSKTLTTKKEGVSSLLLEVDEAANGNAAAAKAADLDYELLQVDARPPCTITKLDVNFFQQRIQTEAGKAVAAIMAELKKNNIKLTKSTVASLKAAVLKHVVSGGALNQQALTTVVGTTLQGSARDLAAKSLMTGLEAMDLSVDFCLFKKIAGKDIYFKGRLSGDIKTKKLSGALTLLTRIDVGYLHLAQASVAVKDVNPKDIKNVNVEIKGEFCCGFVTDCEKAKYKGFGSAQGGSQDASSAVSDAKDKTFTGVVTIKHAADGTNSIAVNAGSCVLLFFGRASCYFGPSLTSFSLLFVLFFFSLSIHLFLFSGGLTLGKLFYVNVGAAVDAARAQKVVNFMGDFAAVGVKKMGLEWKKTKAKVTKRFFAKPSFGDVSKFTCDVGDDHFTASKCALKSLAVSIFFIEDCRSCVRLTSCAPLFLFFPFFPTVVMIQDASGDATIEVVSERDVVPKVEDDDIKKPAANPTKDVALVAEAEAKSIITLTIKRGTAIVTVVFASETVRAASFIFSLSKRKRLTLFHVAVVLSFSFIFYSFIFFLTFDV